MTTETKTGSDGKPVAVTITTVDGRESYDYTVQYLARHRGYRVTSRSGHTAMVRTGQQQGLLTANNLAVAALETAQWI